LSITSPVKDIGVLFFCCPGHVANPGKEIPVKNKIAAELLASNFMVPPNKSLLRSHSPPNQANTPYAERLIPCPLLAFLAQLLALSIEAQRSSTSVILEQGVPHTSVEAVKKPFEFDSCKKHSVP